MTAHKQTNLKPRMNDQQEEFFLDGHNPAGTHEPLDFALETQFAEQDHGEAPVQENLLFDREYSENPSNSPQIDLDGMSKPIHQVTVKQYETTQNLAFQHANNLLESLEAQDVAVQYQCREGYCGSCRVQLLEGEVHYIDEPMAWVNSDEVLPCCCIPKTAIRIKLP